MVFIDWWADENELHHHVFVSPPGSAKLEYRTPEGLLGCVWDIHLIHFERAAWIATVLAAEGGSNLDAYLDAQLNADI